MKEWGRAGRGRSRIWPRPVLLSRKIVARRPRRKRRNRGDRWIHSSLPSRSSRDVGFYSNPNNFRCVRRARYAKNTAAMFSLQRLLGKEDKFFGLLEASAEEARTSVQALVRLSKALDKPRRARGVRPARGARTRKSPRTISATRFTPPSSPRSSARTSRASPTRSTRFPRPSRNSPNASCSRRTRSAAWISPGRSACSNRPPKPSCRWSRASAPGVNLDEIKALNDKLQHIEGEADKR